MRVALAQLPMPAFRHDLGRYMLNVPLGPGALAAMGRSAVGSAAEIHTIGNLDSLFAGDQALLDAIIRLEPDVVGLSLHQWNRDRSLHIAHLLREQLPNVKIWAGGPEIDLMETGSLPDEVDIAVMGEGEDAFSNLLLHHTSSRAERCYLAGTASRVDGQWRVGSTEVSRPDLSQLPSAFLCGCLDANEYGSIWIETTRGCMCRCAYCGHAGTYAPGREFGRSRITGELQLAKQLRLSSMFLLSPTLNVRGHCSWVCQLIEDAHLDPSQSLCAEVHPEFLSGADAACMARAGITDVEIGLQSTNPSALQVVNRSFSPKRFAKGIDLLRRHGLRIHCGIILGLPGDTIQGVRGTLDFIEETGLSESTSHNLLSVAPGTELRRSAGRLGIAFQKHPSYRILSTEGMSFDELREADALCTEHLGSGKPGFAMSAASYCLEAPTSYRIPEGNGGSTISTITLGMQSDVGWTGTGPGTIVALSSRLADAVQVHCKIGGEDATPHHLVNLLRMLSRPNLYTVWTILLYSRDPFDVQLCDEIEASIAYRPGVLDFENVLAEQLTERQYVRAGSRLLVAVRPDAGLRQRRWVDRLRDRSQVLWDCARWDSHQEVDFALGAARNGECLLVDFPALHSARDIVKIMDRLGSRSGDPTRILFRDYILQRDWEVKTQGNSSLWNGLAMLHVDSLGMSEDHISKSRVANDVLCWELAKRLGVSRHDARALHSDIYAARHL